ncbi:MAG: peroxidase-related enzyme [Burkholderiaceae bacterium]|nr:peroxidase-related enzyme [Burkholderiaceae bacterium]
MATKGAKGRKAAKPTQRLSRTGKAPRGKPVAGDRYPLAELSSLPPDLRERIVAVQEKAGFVPDVFLKLARRPAEFRAFFAYHDALMTGEGPLTKAEREMIVVATSAINDCLYCVVAHGAILRIHQKDPLIADQVAVNYRKAPLPARSRAILDFACKVATDSAALGDEDYERLLEHGLDAEAAWDIASIAAFFALSNRMANASGMMPNEEFYRMGR